MDESTRGTELKTLKKVDNMPKLNIKWDLKACDVLVFLRDFQAAMGNQVPDDSLWMQYLRSAVEGPMKPQLQRLRNISYQELLLFVLEGNTLGSSWKSKVQKEMQMVRQMENEKIIDFAERLVMYLDYLKIDLDSVEVKMKLNEPVLKVY